MFVHTILLLLLLPIIHKNFIWHHLMPPPRAIPHNLSQMSTAVMLKIIQCSDSSSSFSLLLCLFEAFYLLFMKISFFHLHLFRFLICCSPFLLCLPSVYNVFTTWHGQGPVEIHEAGNEENPTENDATMRVEKADCETNQDWDYLRTVQKKLSTKKVQRENCG